MTSCRHRARPVQVDRGGEQRRAAGSDRLSVPPRPAAAAGSTTMPIRHAGARPRCQARSSQHPCCCFRQPPRMAHRVLYTCLPPPVAACARIPLVLVLTVMQHVHDLHGCMSTETNQIRKKSFSTKIWAPRIGRISIVTYAVLLMPCHTRDLQSQSC